MAEESKEPGKVMKFIQDYRMKMLIPELIVVFCVFYLAEESLNTNMYAGLGIWGLILQPLYMVPSGMLVLVTAFTLHGIYPLDNYHEGKISDLPKAAVVMIIVSFILLPGLVLMQMIGYYMTEATEFVSRNPFWERVDTPPSTSIICLLLTIAYNIYRFPKFGDDQIWTSSEGTKS